MSNNYSFQHARVLRAKLPGLVEVEVHAIGHSAGLYGATVLAAVLEENAFSKTNGSTKVAIAMSKSLLTRHYWRQVKLVHVEKEKKDDTHVCGLCVGGMEAWVLATTVFLLFVLFLLHCICPKRLAMAAMWETILAQVQSLWLCTV